MRVLNLRPRGRGFEFDADFGYGSSPGCVFQDLGSTNWIYSHGCRVQGMDFISWIWTKGFAFQGSGIQNLDLDLRIWNS